uniref:Early nodulin-like protein 1 n=1 Tax=Cajanus cajan TaxID=3821 RepID=A0A151TB31_CAJCA|nr:Early nodulin-like protein 1 [Cajanus cajan]
MAPPIAAHLAVFTLLVTVSAAATGYHNHTVGGAAGGSFDSATNATATNYSSWASNQTFDLGDYLIFNTNSNQTVVQTYNKTTYLNCTADETDNGTFVRRFGEALTIAVPLTIVGPNYFFSDAADGVQCQHGLAFEIDVQRGLGLPPSLNQPPPPPYQEPPGPDAGQSPPVAVAQSPSGSAFASRADVRVAVYGFAAALLVLLQFQ